MKALLAEKGISIGIKGEILLNGVSDTYEGWNFQPNGRIKFKGDKKFSIEAYTLSTHQFILEYC